MTISDFKKIARLLKTVYAEIEKQAINEGFDLLSPEYTELIDKARLMLLEKHGFTLEEYREVKAQVEGVDKAGTLAVMQDTQKKVKEISERHIPTEEEIEEIAERVAQKYIVPPQITNEIVKEYTIEKPKIVETTRIIKENYNSKPLEEKLEKVNKRLDDFVVPKIPDFTKFANDLRGEFSENFKHNIDTLGMPDFRKLAMGLQQQIDEISTTGGTGGGHTIQDEGASETQRTNLNFVGAGVSVTDDSGNDATVVTINGGGDGAISTYIDQTPDNGTYGTLAGTVNGSNTLFTVAQGSYGSGTLQVYLNGVLQLQGDTDDWEETTPNSGTFTFNTAPPTDSVVTAVYQNVAGSTIGIEVLDEGGSLTSALSSIDFVGAGVTATNVGGAVTVTIGGGGAGYTNLTEFIAQTAWRVFYSNGSGDVTELALGVDGTFLKSNGASSAPTFAVPAGAGDVSKVGTPLNNQIPVWTGDGTLEGTSDFTYDGTSLNLITGKNFQIAGGTVLADSAGTLTLSGIDAIDATTEATIEAAIDTLANLVSIQGRTVTLADAGADVIFGWDDSANAYENLTTQEVLDSLGITASIAEINFIDGVTSAIQTQITARALTATTITIAGTANQVISSAGAQDLSANRTWTLSLPQSIATSSTPQFAKLGIGAAADANRLLYVTGDVSGGTATIERTNASTNAAVGTAIIKGTSTGDMADGFGSAFQFAIQDTAAVENIVGGISVVRDGADTKSKMFFNVANTAASAAFMQLQPTALSPVSNDLIALGTTALGWSDLHLAAGGVINWAGGEITITETDDATLTIAGMSVLNLGGTTTVSLLAIEMGGNTSNTLSASGGVLSIEGVVIPTISSTNTLTNKTLQAGIIDYVIEPASDDTYEGEVTNDLNAGDTIAQWDLVYLDSTSGRWEFADADAAATSGQVLLALATASGTDGNPMNVIFRGIVRNDGWTWTTVGAPLYVSGTPGAITQTAPSGTDDVIRIVGYVISDDCIYFNPESDFITHT